MFSTNKLLEKAEYLGYEVIKDKDKNESFTLCKQASHYKCDIYVKVIASRIVDYYIFPYLRNIRVPSELYLYTLALADLRKDVKVLKRYQAKLL